ncbi:hypothetical protein QVD17_03854 [Tagetes erecta]|uniref:RRM domain-containing protein n=1 Tax=Tagetes erecta TaxID=13708 RepID=A0AAD8LF59_TARER|nr:hypothetical protein QVD17_03854 [Tagetes erecta]
MPESPKAMSTFTPVVVVAQPTKNGKRDAEEIIEKKVASGKKQKISDEGDDDSSPNEYESKNPVDVAKNGDVAAKKKDDSKDKSESDDCDNVGEDDAKDAAEAKAPVKPAAKIKEESNDDKGSSDQEPAEPQVVKEKASGSEEKVNSSKVEEPKSAKKDDADVEMVDARSAEKKAPQTPATPQAPGSKILFMGNLNFSIEENDVLDFFKDAGEVVEVRFAMREDRFAGFAHVEFATPDAARKALKLDNELLLDRSVRLELAKERGAYTPRNNSNDRSSQKSGPSQGLTVFVRGFGTNDGFESVRSALEEHFGQCGEIKRLTILKDYESGGPKGVAFIDFTNGSAFNKALKLSGTKVSGGTITVEEAKQRGGGGDGGGYGRGKGGTSGGRGWFGGRDGARGRGRGRGRGR